MIRTYGKPPYTAAILHGGPGAVGSAAPIAVGISSYFGVLEPFQSKETVAGQIEELDDQLQSLSSFPVALIGHSWGAWLALLYAAEHPERVKQVVLVGSGPLEAKYTSEIMQRRLNRLSEQEADLFKETLRRLEGGDVQALEILKRLVEKTDNYNIEDIETYPVNERMYSSIWPEADRLRREGLLIKTAERVACPISVIQGEQDPHPIRGVTEPLTNAGISHTAFLLPKCGHSPFIEKEAKKAFFSLLNYILYKSL